MPFPLLAYNQAKQRSEALRFSRMAHGSGSVKHPLESEGACHG